MIEAAKNNVKQEEGSDTILESLLTGIDKNTANLQLPDPDLRDFYRDENDRILWLTDQIEADTLVIVRKIIYYNRMDKGLSIEERKPIKLFIDTNGGSVAVMWTLINAILISKTPVWTINWCECLSAGAHILAAGHKRFALPGSTILIHSGSCVFGGTVEQADNAKKYYDSINKQSDALLLKETEIDAKILKKKSPFDWYLTPEEALKYKIIDKIVEDFDEIL